MNTTRIIIADDHSVVREGLKVLIKKNPRLNIVGEAGNGIELLAQLKSKPCDVAIVDIAMPEMDGLAALKEIRRVYPGVKVLMLSMLKDYEHFRTARVNGAAGYIAKDDAGDELIAAIDSVANKNIASKLKISIHTVENHRAHLSDKLGLNNTASLVKYAIEKGIA
jgi:DNA-binding NarL/FixJ family response regulator